MARSSPTARWPPNSPPPGSIPQSGFTATCGSGVTATSLLFAARRLGGRDARLYDGSWSEYGADPATPKAMGPA